MLNKLVHEPLVHFLLLGALLFLLFDLLNDQPTPQATDRIVISEAQIDNLVARWQKQWQRPPSAEELNGLVEQTIREQVLYREALALGLDRDDPVVRRRMAQKIEFISSDLTTQVEPTEEQLADYFKQNADKFMQPGSSSFIQVFLNADRRGSELDGDAARLLDTLRTATSPPALDQLGDPFMFGQVFTDQRDFETTRMFGREFSEALATLPVGEWQGPVYSGLGAHLVRIDARSDSVLPALNSVRDQVVAEWRDAQRQEMNQAIYQRMREKYEIVLPSSLQQP